VRSVNFRAVTKEFHTFKTCIRRLQILSGLEQKLGRGRKACVQNDGVDTHAHALFVAGILA